MLNCRVGNENVVHSCCSLSYSSEPRVIVKLMVIINFFITSTVKEDFNLTNPEQTT
jgi:hypothetical protein